MATAVRNPARVVEPPPTYTLTLSEHEAEVLRALTGGHVVGSLDGPRGATHDIYNALVEAGATRHLRPGYFFVGTVTGRGR